MKKPTHRLREQEKPPSQAAEPFDPGLVTPDMLKPVPIYRSKQDADGQSQKVDPKRDPLKTLDLGATPGVRIPLGPERCAQPTLRDVLPKPVASAPSPQDELLQLVTSLGLRSRLATPELAQMLRTVADRLAPDTSPVRAAPPLLDLAPEAWAARDLNRRETPPQFIARVYGQWLGRGLSRKHVKALDPDLYRALSVWLTRHPDEEIAQSLPRQSDLLDRLIDRLAAEYSLDELRRLGYAIDARLKREVKKARYS